MSGLTASEQDRIWDHYQNAGQASFSASLPRLSYLAQQIAPGSRVLNIGIGAGQFEQAAAPRGFELYQLDPNEKAIATARQRANDTDKYRTGYSQAMPFEDHQFDAIVASELLEHLPDAVLNQTLVEVARVLRVGGVFVGTVPARENLIENAMFCPHCQQTFHRWGHEQSFTVKRMSELLSLRFHVRRVSEKQFVCWQQLNWRGKVVAAARLVLNPLISPGKNIVFVATLADS
jgi:SAM-dependent methyltransferase